MPRKAHRQKPHPAPQRRSKATSRAGQSPQFIASLAVSLDGYIASVDGEVSWLEPYSDALAGFGTFIKTLGALVMGRGTYDFMVRHPMGASPYGPLPMYVLSNRPLAALPSPAPPITRISGDIRELAEQLRSATNGHIWLMGGGVTLKAFLEADLIDRWDLAVIPVILGDGIPLLPKATPAVRSLRLARTRTFKSGVVSLVYERC